MKRFTFDEKMGHKLEWLVAELLPELEIVNAYKDGMLTIKDAGGQVSSIHWLELLIFNVYKRMSDLHAEVTNDKSSAVQQHKICHMLINANSTIHPIETAYIEWRKIKALNVLKSKVPAKETTKELDSTKVASSSEKIEA